VKANQKDMPKPTEDSWAKDKHKDGEEKEEVWDPTKICGHPDCGLQVCSDRLVSEFFCCGKCSTAFYSHQKPQHGQRCEAKTPKKTTKAKPPPADPSAGGGSWKKKTTAMRWGSYGNGRSYGKAWSQWEPPAESKEQTKGLRAWSDDDEPPVKGTNAAKKAQEKEEKDKDKDKGENSNAWSKWNSGGNSGYSGNSGNSGWKKSNNWSDWSRGWKSSWSKGWGNSQRGSGGGGMETVSLEEAEERRQKRLERFGGETSVKKSDKVCHINWSTDTTKNEDADAGTTEKPEPEAAEAAKKDQSDDERAKQIHTGERARSEDHEDD